MYKLSPPVLIAHDLDTAVSRLAKITGHEKEIIKIFNLLIKRDSKYYEFKEQWKQSFKKAK